MDSASPADVKKHAVVLRRVCLFLLRRIVPGGRGSAHLPASGDYIPALDEGPQNLQIASNLHVWRLCCRYIRAGILFGVAGAVGRRTGGAYFGAFGLTAAIACGEERFSRCI